MNPRAWFLVPLLWIRDVIRYARYVKRVRHIKRERRMLGLSAPEFAMLAKREGTTRVNLPCAPDKLYWTRQSESGMLLLWEIHRPCTILVIPEVEK